MKIIFVLDDQSVLVTSPEDLQLRQISPDTAAIGVSAGKNENDEELYRPLINYSVVITIPLSVGESFPAQPPELT